MGVRTIEGFKDGDRDDTCALMYDSVSGWAFGPTFKDADEVEDFLSFVAREADGKDPRSMDDPELQRLHNLWLNRT
jgi:hypothetical protein